MTSFLFDALKDLEQNYSDISKLTFILPSKRAGLFLKHEIQKISQRTIFAPEILSIEEFVEELSQLQSISNSDLLFEFYSIYQKITPKEEQDTFDSFAKWGQVLLQDFNEIDRYLIPQKQIFDYLSAIQNINHWSSENNQTEFIKKYLLFWNKLSTYYDDFVTSLINKNIGYQGLIYREAVENIESFIQNTKDTFYIFIGFNALNTAEETIIQELLQNELALIYWDIDEIFINNPKHDAALFTRQHKNNWPYFKKHSFKWVTNNYSKPKNISVVGIPKNVGQAKYIGELLLQVQEDNTSLKQTAIVLSDEDLLLPVLNSIPNSVGSINITMGFPLKSMPLASLFERLFKIHKVSGNSFYYKDIVSVLTHQFIRPLLIVDKHDFGIEITQYINKNNIVYLNTNTLVEIAPKTESLLKLLFADWKSSIEKVLSNCSELIFKIKAHLDEDKTGNKLSLEYLYRFHILFNEISRLNAEYKHIADISSLHTVYKELLRTETLDFQGEPLEGLQIMGMLESRVLDFETVIISSVNEGILPAGKTNNSFIPFDVKLENKLPTYKEKDAVYTYHFYRLLQRAKNVFILYNTEADALLGGEKSRFIAQLQLENIHSINHQIIAPKVPKIEKKINIVEKTNTLVQDIFTVAKKGFSPSSLTNYIRNPIDFYYQKILKIKEFEDVEETVAVNTLGTVVHNTLEDLYKPFINTFITTEIIKGLIKKVEGRVTHHFKMEYKDGDISKGKNLIVYEIAKRYVLNFLDKEIADLNGGNTIKILQIETTSTIEIEIPTLEFPIKLTGKVDRVDAYNGVTRIIDYKTGNVQQTQVEIVDWEDITTDYKKYSKSFQVLMYAYLIYHSKQINLPIEAGIISFKNLSSGFLKFGQKVSERGRKKDTLITQETLERFEFELKQLISEICNPEIPFIEKEV